jgi:hypothetical protein
MEITLGHTSACRQFRWPIIRQKLPSFDSKPKDKRIAHQHQDYAMMNYLLEYLPVNKRASGTSLIDASKELDSLRCEQPSDGWWCHPSAWVY